MIHYIGYAGLALALLAMSMKQMMPLRILSVLANAIYLIYGIFLDAPPFIIGCSIAISIHLYHIYILKIEQADEV